MIYKRKCKYCGKEFETNISNNVFCCNEHKNKYHHRTKEYKQFEDRVCPVCGVTFTPKTYQQTYCCPEHKIDARNKKRRKSTVYEKTCPICGSIFHTRYSFQTYCCEEHAKIASIENQKAKKIVYQKVCPICGIPFKATRKNQATCCKEHQREYARARTKERRKLKREEEGPIKYVKTCKYCGKEFETSSKLQLFCCKEHRKKYQREKDLLSKVIKPRKCKICGFDFIPENPRIQICSDECREQAKQLRNKRRSMKKRVGEKEKICPVCGGHFKTNTTAICCSPECTEEYRRQHRKEYKSQNKERIKNYNKEYKASHKEETSLYNKEYKQREGKKERANQRKREFRQENLELVRTRDRERSNRRYAENILFRMTVFARGQVHRCIIDKAGKRTFDILGYTSEELKAHIESLWEHWMTWDNYGEGEGYWNIDHIKPLSAFNFVKEDGSPDFDAVKEANALINLRPLASVENSWVKRDTWTSEDEEAYQERKRKELGDETNSD